MGMDFTLKIKKIDGGKRTTKKRLLKDKELWIVKMMLILFIRFKSNNLR